MLLSDFPEFVFAFPVAVERLDEIANFLVGRLVRDVEGDGVIAGEEKANLN